MSTPALRVVYGDQGHQSDPTTVTVHQVNGAATPIHLHFHGGSQVRAIGSHSHDGIPLQDRPGRKRSWLSIAGFGALAAIGAFACFEFGAVSGEGRARADAMSSAAESGGIASMARPPARATNPTPPGPADIARSFQHDLSQPGSVIPPAGGNATSNPASPFGLQH